MRPPFRRLLSRLLPLLLLVLALPALAQAQDQPVRYRAVLVAGDGSLPVWDNAVQNLASLLGASLVPGQVQRLSAAPQVLRGGQAQPATLDRVLNAVAAMRPAPGEGCLVFVTAHGAPREGVALVASREYLTPEDLDTVLSHGCGEAPTVVIISACYSGTFARAPITRPNRIIMTAARPDRPSFGCGAGRTYTVFDQCLLQAGRGARDWQQVANGTSRCVAQAEAQMRETPSQPQRFFGPQVAQLALPEGGADGPVQAAENEAGPQPQQPPPGYGGGLPDKFRQQPGPAPGLPDKFRQGGRT